MLHGWPQRDRREVDVRTLGGGCELPSLGQEGDAMQGFRDERTWALLARY